MATVNKSDPYKRVAFRGVTLDERTKSALLWAERRYIKVAPKKRKPWRLGQGSYSAGSLSAGTHAGGGAVDIMFAGMPKKQQRATVRWLRRAGFAAWMRVGGTWSPGNEHAHAILRGHRTASPEAKAQVVAYDDGRDGLVTGYRDTFWRPRKPRRWSHKQGRPIIGK